MTRLSPHHPRYRSLKVRASLAEAFRHGVVVPEGLIAQGRGEAFDYFLGERTSPSARRASRIAARWLWEAKRPVVSVNGNVAALAAEGVARLKRLLPKLGVEVNLFHWSPGRLRSIASRLRAAGVTEVLGLRPSARIPHLPSDRARVDPEGILRADVCLVPLEDGDRTAALRALGKRVITVDLNPLSRSSLDADLPIVDELGRALDAISSELDRLRRAPPTGPAPSADARSLRAAALAEMVRRLTRAAGAPPARRAPRRRAFPRPSRGTVRRSRRRR